MAALSAYMNRAQEYIEYFYSKYDGRACLKAGSAGGFSFVYPFVFENKESIPVGLVSMAWEKGSDENLVRIFHVSSFKNKRGHGSFILSTLCEKADEFCINLTLQAEPQENGLESIDPCALVNWYRKFGFVGNCIMVRNAVST